MKKLITLATIFFSAAVLAELQTIVGHWEDGGVTTVLYRPGESNHYAFASIDVSEGGEQRIYISYMASPGANMCSKEASMENVTYKINGQNVRMIEFCESNEDGDLFKQATAKSDKGIEFVYNEFRRSNKVFVEWPTGGAVNISAKGFINEWDSAGGDAL